MRSSRLLSLLLVLQTRGRASAGELAREFEVSERTIYRDVDALSAAGVPIYAETGRNGGVRLHEGYRTRLTGLTAKEAAAVPLAGLAAAARDLGMGGDAGAAQLKLLASLPEPSGTLARRIAERFHIDSVPWYHRPEALEALPVLAQAVWRGKRIAFAYESWKGNVARRADPLGLVQKGGAWYLVAAVRATPRVYRVSNISHLEILDADATRPTRFDLKRFWTTWGEEFEARLLSGRARVRLSEEGMRLLRATMPVAAEMAEANGKPARQRGWITATIPIEEPAYAARQLLRLGVELEVLSPPELRHAIAREAAGVAARYARHP